MAYIRYKEVTKRFNFTKSLDIKMLPRYVLDYVFDDETLLAAYKVGRDHGIITDKKIVLFDNTISFSRKKLITTIPFKSVSAHSIYFYPNRAEIYILLDSGYPLLMKFSNTSGEDKLRLRLVYSAMSSVICNQKIPGGIVNKLVNDDIKFND